MASMMKLKIDDKRSARCAFCKHWYDPTNQYIQPYDPKRGFWQFEPYVKRKCLIKSYDTASQMSCSKFENKIDF